MARPNLASEAFVFDDQPAPSPKERKRKVGKVGKVKGRQERAGASRAPAAPADPVLEKRLRDWRLGVAKARRIPAFRILTDRTLQAIAAARPRSMADLAAVGGIGPKLADKYGSQILAVVGGG